MARTQSENYADIRRGILRRSAALFARVGYPNASIADLAKANRVSRGLLYHYFDSKEKILAEMLSEHLDFLLGEVRAAARRGADAETRFRATVRAMVLINADSKDLQIVLLHDLHNLEPADRGAIVKKQRDIVAILSGLVRACDVRGKIDARTLKAQTMMLIGMINYTYIWYDPAGPVTPEEYAALVSGTYLGGLVA
ncbi:MAG: TetR/AcrR family transcriptional regulator [Alphaproteobacteria bacterium]